MEYFALGGYKKKRGVDGNGLRFFPVSFARLLKSARIFRRMVNRPGEKVTDEQNQDKAGRRWMVVGAIAAAAVVGGLAGAGALTMLTSDHRKPVPHGRATRAQKPARQAVDCHVRKCIALTFDDGPTTGTTQLLDILKANDARATFFVLGSQIATNVDTLKREAAEGHEIGNHTFDHAKLVGAPRAKVEDELIRTQQAVLQVTGTAPVLLRPTYGYTDKLVDAIAKEQNLAEVLWTIDTADWRDRNAGIVTQRVLKLAKPGQIVIMHDIRPTTVAAIPNILKTLSQQGYAFVTVSELYGGKLTPGQKYPPFLGSPTAGPAPAGA